MRAALEGEIRSNFEGFSALTRLYAHIAESHEDWLFVDMSRCEWMDANMCAPLGAILCAKDFDQVEISGMRAGLKEILRKNGFLEKLGVGTRAFDTYSTTIEFCRFDRPDIRHFMDYVRGEFRGKGLPDMTEELRREFRRSIAELFLNAAEHSETERGVFTCGQLFPNLNRLNFSVADLGIGMRERILRDTGQAMSAPKAIWWAVRHTTRKAEKGRPGGLGLKLIREFINLNGGTIQIVSDRGYWEFHSGQEMLKQLECPFLGTVVNIQIDTADTKSYSLSPEHDPIDIPF